MQWRVVDRKIFNASANSEKLLLRTSIVSVILVMRTSALVSSFDLPIVVVSSADGIGGMICLLERLGFIVDPVMYIVS